MTEIIEVTQADIDAALNARKWTTTCLTESCPIAQALKRTYGETEVRAHPDYLGLGDFWEGRKSVGTTQSIRTFMRRWDRTGRAVPTRFRIEWR